MVRLPLSLIKPILVLSFLSATGIFSLVVWDSSSTELIQAHITLKNSSDQNPFADITIALVSDLHLRNPSTAIDDWQQLIHSINNSAADYVLLAGDYIANIKDASIAREIQDRFIESLETIEKPYALVLGNYETWTDRQSWLDAFAAQGIPALENQTIVLQGDKPICVIGVGDAYTGYDTSVSVPPDCSQYPIIQLTHDPSAAFKPNSSGIWLAGHTHCGQVRLPLLGPLWVPSQAPKESHCGLYEDEVKKVFVSSGVGNSVLPLRFLAQSQIEILTFN